MKILSVILSLIFILSCATNHTFAESELQQKQDYERQQNAATKSFQELENAMKYDNKTITLDKPKPTETIDKKRLTDSNIFEKSSPLAVSCDKSIRPSDEQPCWIQNPDCVKGYKLAAVGSAKEQSGGRYAQRKAATLQARAELSRMIQIYIENEIKITEKYDRAKNMDDYERTVETKSRQRSASYIDNITEVDCYIYDNDFFILLGVK